MVFSAGGCTNEEFEEKKIFTAVYTQTEDVLKQSPMYSI